MLVTMIQASAKSADDQSTVAFGESMFSTVQMTQDQNTKEGEYYTIQHAAATVVDMRSETSTTFNNSEGMKYIYMRFHATSNTKTKGGWNIIASSAGCPGNTLRLYYSFSNPLVDSENYAGKSDKTDDYAPNMFIPNNNGKPVFVSLKMQGQCEAVTVQAWPAGSQVESISTDNVVEKTIGSGETLQFEFLLDGSQYNQDQAFMKIAVDTNELVGRVFFALTNQMYIGPASEAPEDIKIASGYLEPYGGILQEVVKFKNKYKKYQYLTITRMDVETYDQDINVRFQISHPQRLINDRPVLVSNPNSTFMYTVIDLSRNQDIRLGFNSTSSEATGVIGKLYIMPYLPDFAADLNKFKSFDVDTNNDINLTVESDYNHIGRNYYLI